MKSGVLSKNCSLGVRTDRVTTCISEQPRSRDGTAPEIQDTLIPDSGEMYKLALVSLQNEMVSYKKGRPGIVLNKTRSITSWIYSIESYRLLHPKDLQL